MRSGDKDKVNICGIHGKNPYWVKSAVVKGEICIACVVAGYFRDDIQAEIHGRYPGAYACVVAGTIDQYKDVEPRGIPQI
jgi:hypothetical protein